VNTTSTTCTACLDLRRHDADNCCCICHEPLVRFHLTHTGPYAGQPICGSAARTPSDQHPSYSAAGLARQLANCCPECAQLWTDTDTECAECGHLHWNEAALTYTECPVDECTCRGQA